ncbi:MAG TPA: thioredoxin domain-containing protein [Segeticoccus sp.]|nr:thioredoxin domain-containing protein [Segeticoccus sp.]
MRNRLGEASSPYLLQHKDNPVPWQEWGPAAFAEAQRRQVPIFLSVGYAACHWCHVMAHESFEDDEVARVLDADFVAVKVDREERPDVDAVYMTATTAMTGAGGWPMTCLLTPEGEPFYCATYVPRPQLLQLLAAVTEAWTERREEVLASGSHIAGALRQASQPAAGPALGATELDRAAAMLADAFDERSAGFGRAPKFPPSMVLEFLLRRHVRTGDARSLIMVERTCEAMARGGIHDQLAGGFARYSVDAHWVVPHFEKMLYDNAQLLRVHLHLWRLTGSPLAERVARETADFLVRDLGTPEGGFASALDADTSGVEGLTYVWSPEQLRSVLGPDDGPRAAELLRVTPEGTFEDGTSTLQLPVDPEDAAWWAGTRARLLAARRDRPQPERDDKVVTAWNGLAVAALAEAGTLLECGEYLGAATRCAQLLWHTHIVNGRLRRVSRHGRVGVAEGVADDHGDLAEGLLALHQATGDAVWLERAGTVLDWARRRFAADDGGFHDTAHDAEQLFTRPRDPADNAEPSGQSALAGALLTHSALTGSSEDRSLAESALRAGAAVATRDPRFAGWALAVAEAALAGPLQVAVSTTEGDEGHDLLRVTRMSPSPGLVHVAGPPDSAGIPLLAGRPATDGSATAYLCRGFVCDAPTTEADALRAALSRALVA